MTQGAITAQPNTRRRDEPQGYTPAVVVVLLFLLPLNTLGLYGVSVGAVLAVLVGVPLFWRPVRYHAERWVFLLWGAALLCGPLLASWAIKAGGRSLDRNIELHTLAWFGTGALTLAALLWGRSLLGLRKTALAYGLGGLAEALANPAAWADNPWKYAFAWPVAIVLLAYFRRHHVLLLTGLAMISVLFDFRSFAGLCALAAALVIWSGKPNDNKARTLRQLVKVAVLAFVLYQGGSWLAVNGHLGESIQGRTVAQTQTGQPLIVAARPEWAAAVDLAKSQPAGFGPGVIPDAFDLAIARSGLATVGASANNKYIDHYLLGAHVELHSVASDLWVDFGLLGLTLAITLAWQILSGFGLSLSRGGLSPLTALAVVSGLWDLAFSPLTNLPHVVFALALCLHAAPADNQRQSPAYQPELSPAVHSN